MKRYGNLYEQIYSMDNLRKAHKSARKGKGWYEEVKEVDANIEVYLKQLQEMLINHTYHTSNYEKFIKKENGKEREIFKLPYFPESYLPMAILQVIEPYLMRHMTKNNRIQHYRKGEFTKRCTMFKKQCGRMFRIANIV